MSDALLSAGLMTVLTHEPDLEVELCTTSDLGLLLAAFNQSKPQVVVLQQGAREATERILAEISGRRLDVHMILINDGNNWLDSFRHHRHQVGNVSDLLSVIRSP